MPRLVPFVIYRICFIPLYSSNIEFMSLPEVDDLISHLWEVRGLPGYSVREPVRWSVSLQFSFNFFISHLWNHKLSLSNRYIMIILTHLAYRANAKKSVVLNDIVTVVKACGKRALAVCYCKMTSVVALEGVTLFLCLKDVIYLCKSMPYSSTIGRISSVQWGKVGRC